MNGNGVSNLRLRRPFAWSFEGQAGMMEAP
jgi:hypothetical protein